MHRKKASMEAQAAVAKLGGGVPVVLESDVLPGADLVRE